VPKLPPLVEPASQLSPAEIERYSRHLLIPDVGMAGQLRLKNACVLVVGAGGLGSPALLYLAAAGVGTLGIVEFDDVEISNLQRQVIHGRSDVGRKKAESARDSIRELNEHVAVRLHEFALSADNAIDLFRQYDVVVDGTDNFATRYLISDAAALSGKPVVWGSIFRFEGQASVFWADAPGGAGITYRDLYPEPPMPGTVPSCAEGGVLGSLCAAIGSIMATEAVKLITGIGESLLGRLLMHDALRMEYRTVALEPDPARVPVQALVDYELLCGAGISGQPAEAPAPAGAEISAVELKKLMDEGAEFTLVDVREPAEFDIVRIPGATLIPKGRIISGEALPQLRGGAPVIVYCKGGARSAEALAALRAAGFDDARHVPGGVLAWVADVDPSLPVY
jgi:adenylyltransferase/sulfurtransferase